MGDSDTLTPPAVGDHSVMDWSLRSVRTSCVCHLHGLEGGGVTWGS